VIRIFFRYSIVKIQERDSFFGIIWVMRVLRFIRTTSYIRDGLHKGGRVLSLSGVLWSTLVVLEIARI
jgi:hypothetical protein